MWSRRASFVVVGVGVLLVVSAMPVMGNMLYGASPASLTFDGGGKGLLRGGSAERSLSLQNQGDDPLTFAIALEGAAGTWLSVASSTVTVAPHASSPVKVKATVPTTASNGAYDAMVRITPAVPAGSSGQGASSTIVQEIMVPVRIQVTDAQTIRLTVARLGVPDAEQGGRLFVEIDATNDGNVLVRPDVVAVMLDEQAQTRLGTLTGKASELAPQMSSRIVADLGAHGLSVGSYVLRVQTGVADGETKGGGPRDLHFDIVPQGTLAVSVEKVVLMFGEGKAKKGDLVPIRVTFENQGDAPIVAGFTGLVTKEGKPIEEVKLDPVEVASGRAGKLEGFWRATGSGTFGLDGQLTIGAKRVDADPTSFTVQGKSKDSPAAGLFGIVAALGVAVVVARRWS